MTSLLQRLLLFLFLAAAAVAVYYLVAAPRTPGTAGNGKAPTASAEGTREASRTLRIGWTAWSDAEFVSQLVERVLEDEMGQEVELVMADIGIQYQGVADGSLDAMLMAWLPTTHRNYWKRLGEDVVNLGPAYTGARLGWVVPDYVPEEELSSLADLGRDAVQKRLGGRVHGIDPGSGLMQASDRALSAYGLDGIELVSSSGAAMTAALERAIRREEWIVVTGWSPHWMFARWDLRYLDDPRGALGGSERIHKIVRRGFGEDFPPEVTAFLSRFHLPLDELEDLLLVARDEGTAEAVRRYRSDHPGRVAYWLTGNMP